MRLGFFYLFFFGCDSLSLSHVLLLFEVVSYAAYQRDSHVLLLRLLLVVLLLQQVQTFKTHLDGVVFGLGRALQLLLTLFSEKLGANPTLLANAIVLLGNRLVLHLLHLL